MWSEVADAFKAALGGQWGSAGFIAAGAIGAIWFVLSLAQRLLPWAVNRDTLKIKSQVDSYHRLEERLAAAQDALVDCRGDCAALRAEISAKDAEIAALRNRIEHTE